MNEESEANGKNKFEQTIGSYEAILKSAEHHIWEMLRVEQSPRHQNTDRSSRYQHPQSQWIKMPRPHAQVYIGLFLGKRTYKLEEVISDEDRIISHIRQIPVDTAAENFCQYLEEFKLEQGDDYSDAAMLQFCAIYGLTAAVENLLKDNDAQAENKTTGSPKKRKTERHVESELSINTCIPFRTKMVEDEGYISWRGTAVICLPIVTIAAIHGHVDLVHRIIHTLNYDLNTKVQYELNYRDEPERTVEGENAIGFALLCCVLGNNSDMVKFLVNECGAQYRWVGTEGLQMIFNKLLSIDCEGDHWDFTWKDEDFNPDDYFGMRELRTARAIMTHKVKMQMLDTLVSTGMPKDLFLPIVDFTIDNELQAQAKAKGMELPDKAMVKEALSKRENRSLNTPDKKYARDLYYSACCSYNMVVKKKETKYLQEYYEFIHKKWENQRTAQRSRLDEFEAADQRWDKHSARGDEVFKGWWILLVPKDEYCENDDYDSDASSCMDNGPFQPLKGYCDSGSNEELDEDEE